MSDNNRVPNALYQAVIIIAALNVPMAGLMFLWGSNAIALGNIATAVGLFVLVGLVHRFEEKMARKRIREEIA